MDATPLRTAIGIALAIGACDHVAAQEVVCDLRRGEDAVVGTCRGLVADPVDVTLRSDETTRRWDGTMRLGEASPSLGVDLYDYADGPLAVVRTPFGWFLPTVLDLDGDPPRLSWSTTEEAPPSRTDLAILDQAAELIRDEGVWDRADDRVCAPSDETFSLYCAMAESVRRVTGEYQHRQPALQIVRRVVAAHWRHRVTNHRMMDFNNHPETTLAEVHAVFAEARTELLRIMR